MGDDRVDFDVTFTYSKEGPVQIEVAQGPAGTPWDVDDHGGPNHNGYWTDDLVGDIARLTAGGFNLVYSGNGDEPGPQGFAMLQRSMTVRQRLKPNRLGTLTSGHA